MEGSVRRVIGDACSLMRNGDRTYQKGLVRQKKTKSVIATLDVCWVLCVIREVGDENEHSGEETHQRPRQGQHR